MASKHKSLSPLKRKLKSLYGSGAPKKPLPYSPSCLHPLSSTSPACPSPASSSGNTGASATSSSSSTDPTHKQPPETTRAATGIEERYFQDPSSRENLSTNPGECGKHRAQRIQCTAQNYSAEIDRRIWGGTDTRDFAYAEGDVQHRCAYGCGDGQA